MLVSIAPQLGDTPEPRGPRRSFMVQLESNGVPEFVDFTTNEKYEPTDAQVEDFLDLCDSYTQAW